MPTTGLFKNLFQSLRYVSNNARRARPSGRHRQSGSRDWSKYPIKRNGQPGTEDSNTSNNRTGYYQKEEKNEQSRQGGQKEKTYDSAKKFTKLIGKIGTGIAGVATGAELYADNIMDKGFTSEDAPKGTPGYKAKEEYNKMGPINSMRVVLRYKTADPGTENAATQAVTEVLPLKQQQLQKYKDVISFLKKL